MIQKFEVAIIGQGIAGSLLAWELERLGIHFVVIDSPAKHKASQVAGGLFYPLAARKIRHSDRFELYWPVMLHTFRALETHFNIKLLFEIPSLKKIEADALIDWQKAANEHLAETIDSVGQSIQLEGVKPMNQAAIILKSGYVNVLLLISTLQDWLKREHRFYSREVDCSRIQLNSNSVVLFNDIEASRVVFCEGASLSENPWFETVAFTPNKGELIEIVAPLLDEQFVLRTDLFVLPLGNHQFRVGATFNRDELSWAPSERGVAELNAKLETLIDVPYAVVKQGAGIRPAMRDRQPVVGVHPQFKQLLILNGFGSRGVLLAPYWASMLAQAIHSGALLFPMDVSVDRFFPKERATVNP